MPAVKSHPNIYKKVKVNLKYFRLKQMNLKKKQTWNLNFPFSNCLKVNDHSVTSWTTLNQQEIIVNPWLCCFCRCWFIQKGELLPWTPSIWIFLSGLDASKVTPRQNLFSRLEFARQKDIYDLLQSFFVHYIKTLTNNNILNLSYYT